MGLDEWLAASLNQAGDLDRPTVTLSYAQSLDGSIALHRGEPLTLSGPESMAMTHRLRAAHDAILVGIGTVISDDPQLNVRLVEGRNPQVVVLDSRLRLPLTARVLKIGKTRVFGVASANQMAQVKLEQVGAIVERQSDERATRVNLRGMLGRLGETGIRSVMVEGGGQVISSFLSENLVDRAIITIAPQFVGGYKGLETVIDQNSELVNEGVEKHGKDYVFWGEIASSQ
ncbi:MAG TPA: RibD family protein [Anaerolineales bacterium]|nr:RibD family protein [Anaerolineales bacterium]